MINVKLGIFALMIALTILLTVTSFGTVISIDTGKHIRTKQKIAGCLALMACVTASLAAAFS